MSCMVEDNITTENRTTVQIHQNTRDRLFQQKNGSTDTYDAVINRLIGRELEGPSLDKACPVCDEGYEKTRHMENGQWANEPASVFGMDDVEGYFCYEWNSSNLRVYYHTYPEG